MMEPLANFMARRTGDDLLDELHAVQALHGGETAVAVALAAMTAAAHFVRTAVGDEAASAACGMTARLVRDRLDVVMPVGKARR